MDDMAIATINPYTGKTEKTFPAFSDKGVDARIAQSTFAFNALKSVSLDDRAALMRKAADLTEALKNQLAELATREMGKPLSQAIAEVEKCIWVCRHYADHTAHYLADDAVDLGDQRRAFRRYLPIGPVLAVMPWNFPFWQVYRFAAPTLMAGNTVLLKHASNVPQCALAMEAIFKDAGFPDGAFSTLLVGGDKVERILLDDRVAAATLTGSEPAGRAVASVCGELIKPTVLELGGSDAFIVMPSADLDSAVETAVQARTRNNGQSCIAGKRFIVHAEIYDDFRHRFAEALDALIVGDPMDAATEIGPLVSVAAADELDDQIEAALKSGASIVTGAKRGEGAFFHPGLIENISPDSASYYDEWFGPVAMLFKADDMQDALRIANDSPFGLGGAVFTQDTAEMEMAYSGLEAGATFINSMTASDPRLPFGGIKRSGYGRELAAEGQRAFCNVKTIVVA
jgi:succinate-semialdehyde dehydrogenase/glutarate-semialdehyde dehydrogenase